MKYSVLPLHIFRTFATALVVLLGTGIFAPDASAQRDASLEELLKEANLEGRAADQSPVSKSTVSEVNLKVQWRLYKRVAAENKAGTDELKALEHDGRSLGYINQPAYATAVATLASQQPDMDVGHAMFQSAKYLAPDLPYIYFAHARYAFDRDPGAIYRWAGAYGQGLKRAFRWPDTGIPWVLKFLAFGLLSLFVAGLAFILGQTIRQIGVVAYDSARVLPRGFSSNQAVVLLLALVVVPGLLLRSPLLSLLILMVVLTIPQRPAERVVSAILFIGIALLPRADALVADLAAYAGSGTQALTHAQYVHCDAACIEDLDARQIVRPDDKFIQFTRLLVAFRSGEKVALERVIEEVPSTEWPTELRGYAVNLHGAALIALARPGDAIPVLSQARSLLSHSAAPTFNMMRAHHMLDEVDKASAALQEASSNNVGEVGEFLRYDRRDVNSYLVAARVPLQTFFDYHRSVEREHRSMIAPVWRALAGDRVPFSYAELIGLFGVLFTLLLATPQYKRVFSTPCPRCGMARDPKEAASTGNHAFCRPCYRTFVTGAGLDYQARVFNETVLGRREKMQELMRRGLSVVTPGAGHHLAGRSLSGFTSTFTLMFGVLLVSRPMGVVRPMHELGSTNWGGPETLGWTLISIVVLAAFVAAARDIPPTTARGVK